MLDTPSLSVIQETMPVGTSEALHFHHKAQQFFYILKGTATFIIDDEESIVEAGSGIHIANGQSHQILNHGDMELEFIVVSQPHAHGDRENL